MGGSLALMSEVLQLNKPGFEADLKRKKPYFPVTNGHILTSSGGTFSVGMKLISVNIFFLGRCVSVCIFLCV